MKIRLLSIAENYIEEGYQFYEAQNPGLVPISSIHYIQISTPSSILEACIWWSWDITGCSRNDFLLPSITE